MSQEQNNITLTAPHGLVPFLKNEISSLQFPVKWVSETAIGTFGSYSDAMFLNLWLRTAHHVLYQVTEFACQGLDNLYKGVAAYPWERLIDCNGYICITATVDHPSIRDHRIVNLKCKDAIVDRIVSRKGRRPDSGPEKTGTVITVFWQQNYCSISIDTSGEPLSKRGYRKISLDAPIQETLAAALIYASRFSGLERFINPMCGSGTIAIEAALIGTKTAPGLTRDNFGFMHTLLFNNTAWQEMRKSAIAGISPLPKEQSIIATDNNPDAINAAEKNATNANIKKYIDFSILDFQETAVPSGSGIIMFNPEYGIRLGNEIALIDTYRKIGTFMKHNCLGYRGYVFTGNSKLAGNIGLKSGRKIDFQSGKINCRLYEYELFAGKGS